MTTTDTMNHPSHLTSIPNPSNSRKAPPTIERGDTVKVKLPGRDAVKATFRFARFEADGTVNYVDVYLSHGGQRTVPAGSITFYARPEV